MAPPETLRALESPKAGRVTELLPYELPHRAARWGGALLVVSLCAAIFVVVAAPLPEVVQCPFTLIGRAPGNIEGSEAIPLSAELEAPQSVMLNVPIGWPVEYRIPDGPVLHGRITHAGPMDAATGRGRLRASVAGDPGGARLLPGMRGTAILSLGRRPLAARLFAPAPPLGDNSRTAP